MQLCCSLVLEAKSAVKPCGYFMSNMKASHAAREDCGGLQGGGRIDGRDGDLPSYLRLNSGREIRLDKFTQSHTYAGLDGSPSRRMNKSLIDREVAQPPWQLFAGKKPFLIDPIEIDICTGDVLPKVAVLTDQENSRGAFLPSIMCVAALFSLSPVRDRDKFFSSVWAIWFQYDFAFPIDPEIVEKIRAIDWDLLAVDWSW